MDPRPNRARSVHNTPGGAGAGVLAPFCGRHPAVPAALEYEAAGLRPLAGLKRRLLRSRTGQDLREVDVVFHGRWQVLKIKQNPFLFKINRLKQIFDVNYLFQVSVDLS